MTIIKAKFGSSGQEDEKGARQEKKKPAPLYQFHVSLAFSDPLIWRRLVVPGELSLGQMHEVLQTCMGWSGESNHQFYVGKIFYESAGPGRSPGRWNEADYDLQSLEEPLQWCFTYVYDAGDGWEHEIVLEDTLERGDGKNVPQVVDGEWAPPPEHVGSVHRYSELIHALEHPELEKSRRLLADYDLAGFDIRRFDSEAINAALAARDWLGRRG